MRKPGGREAVAVRNRVNEKHANLSSRLACFRFARPEGFEPPTFWSVAKRSIQLSQGRIFFFHPALPNSNYYITYPALRQYLNALSDGKKWLGGAAPRPTVDSAAGQVYNRDKRGEG